MSFTTKFYTADSHFGHQLMLDPKACGRPFADTKEMDEFLIRMWNDVVKPDDIVYHLGDVFFKLNDGERVRSVFSRLNGRKFLVMGNHDYDKRTGHLHENLASLGWDEPPTQHLLTRDCGVDVFLSHYAQRTWPKIRKGGWHFYGHCHGSLPGMGRSRDVGVDCPDTGYAPRTFQQLTAALKNAEVVFEEGA